MITDTRLSSRRNFLAITAVFLLMPLRVWAAIWNKAAFEAKTVEDATQNLSILNVASSNQLELILPSRAENGAIVQLECISHILQTLALTVLVANNPSALIMHILFKGDALPRFITRIKIAETSAVQAIARSDEHFYAVSKSVEVLENGCSGSDNNSEKFESSIKMRAKLLPTPNPENVMELKVIITHPMLTGYGKDEAGNPIPALFIQLVTVTFNDQVVIEMQLGTGISKNPYFTFRIANANLNDTVKLVWSDNKGNTGNGETQVIN